MLAKCESDQVGRVVSLFSVPPKLPNYLRTGAWAGQLQPQRQILQALSITRDPSLAPPSGRLRPLLVGRPTRSDGSGGEALRPSSDIQLNELLQALASQSKMQISLTGFHLEMWTFLQNTQLCVINPYDLC